MGKPVIIVDGLGKSYRLGQKESAEQSFREALTAPLRRWRQARGDSGEAGERFWALRHVSFDVQAGEVVGVIGRNGAGKSTLLKLLSRITEPTEGCARLRGRVASLLEVGTGFHPELTGRENIYLNGSILGMKKSEIDAKFDEIVAFSEIDKFLDTPVKRYSSGMYVRLAFAVAAHLEPEILIVDEVLAVGDAAFQKKCLGKMQDVASGQGRTILFVSHNMAALQSLCTRGVFLSAGGVQYDGAIEQAVGCYLNAIEKSADEDLAKRAQRGGKGQVRLQKIDLVNSAGQVATHVMTGERVRFVFRTDKVCTNMTCTFTIYDQQGQALTNFSTTVHGQDDLVDPALGTQFICEVAELPLLPGRYRLNVAIGGDGEVQDHLEGAAVFDVEPTAIRGRAVRNGSRYGSVYMHHHWVTPV